LAHLSPRGGRSLRGGFIHLPLLPGQTSRYAAAQGMPLDPMIEAVRIAIDTFLSVHIDQRLAAGAID
jgi:pyroglutamyl-peptidase